MKTNKPTIYSLIMAYGLRSTIHYIWSILHDRRSAVSKSGFSLIEVNMAVLIIGVGLLVVFGLFPAGLREGENGISDTQCALFAEAVLEGLRSEACHNESLVWTGWENIEDFKTNFIVHVDNAGDSGVYIGDTNGEVSEAIEFPEGANPKTYITYMMSVHGEDGGLTRSVSLWVYRGQYVTKHVASFRDIAELYYTKYIYLGE